MSFAATQNVRARELAYCGLFGAAAMLLPVVFHLLKLGSMFMPMYLPLIALAFFVGPLPAALTSFMTPLLSGVLTGMPPFFSTDRCHDGHRVVYHVLPLFPLSPREDRG